jgi:putative Mg2+ transporter-C (MgtC) family protein
LEDSVVSEPLVIVAHLASALAAGSVIGLERSFHGRPAGFRTHALVCLASSLLMLVTLYQWEWLPGVPLETVRTDPTRMAQGIMTGIGFLGAGVIFRDGLSVRGLTTAASIWITAAIGILFGVGFYFPAVLTTALTLGVLSLFRRIEARLPTQAYADHALRFDRHHVMPEERVRALLAEHGFEVSNMTYSAGGSGTFEYRMTIHTSDIRNQARLARTLSADEAVQEFRISPMGD